MISFFRKIGDVKFLLIFNLIDYKISVIIEKTFQTVVFALLDPPS